MTKLPNLGHGWPFSDLKPPSHKARESGSRRDGLYVDGPLPKTEEAENLEKLAEHMTISEDRSAGSNLDMRNLAVLKDLNTATKSLPASSKASNGEVPGSTPMERSQNNGWARPPAQMATMQPVQKKDEETIQLRYGGLGIDKRYISDIRHENNGTEQASNKPRLSHQQDACVNDGYHHNQPQNSCIDGTNFSEIEGLERTIATMQNTLHQLKMQERHQPSHEILYRISDVTYLDHPEWTQGQRLVSHHPIINFDLYLEQNKHIKFIVLRDFEQKQPVNRASISSYAPEHKAESIYLVDEQLRKALKMLLELDWRFESAAGILSECWELKAPYLFIYHQRHVWNDMLAKISTSSRKLLDLLLAYVFKTYGKEYTDVDTLFAQRKVSTNFMKYLFKPGDILISRAEGQHRGLVAKSWPRDKDTRMASSRIPVRKGTKPGTTDYSRSGPQLANSRNAPGSDNEDDHVSSSPVSASFVPHASVPSRQQRYAWAIRAPHKANEEPAKEEFVFEIWRWSFDGEFKKEEDEMSLRLNRSNASDSPYGDVWDMHYLEAYPLKYASQPLIEKLRHRGELFWTCRKRCLVSYWESMEDPKEDSNERFMVDSATFRKLHPENRSYFTFPVETMAADEMEKSEPPDEAFFYLVPPEIKGFNLRTKKWLDLNVDQIHPVVWNQAAFDSLVLDRKTKDLITALISKQISSSKSTDVVVGKGNGLILLLHGGPGTGKTLTAEGVAEIAKKPLYRVTCGDIGTKAEDVEKYLESVFHLGKLWDCVVLLDEAEVFLERRSLDDLQRNALVSVFLRVIEYHEGILVLTSNRVGTFDEAFRSRIQIAVHYPPLRQYQRLQIWKNFIDRLESFKDGAVDVEELRDHLEELQEIEINGRQIRNAITTARQYAEWKGQIMTFEHLKIALEVAARFNDYSEKLRGGLTDDQIAEEEGIR